MDGIPKTEEKLISIPQLTVRLGYTALLQGFFAFYLLRNLSQHAYGWAAMEFVLLVIWTTILKQKLDKWRAPE